MGDFTMPSLGADMDRGRLTEWRVSEGDQVTRGDIVAVIETDKSDVEIEVFETGTVEALLIEPGTEVEVGTPIARITDASDGTGPVTRGPGRSQASVILSPIIRHLAEELEVDATSLTGSGPGGRVTRADVEHARAKATGAGGTAREASPPGATQPKGAGTVAASGRRRASPLARARAAASGTDLADVAGSGPGGVVRLRDLPAASAPGPGSTSPAGTAPVDATSTAGTDNAGTDRRQAMRSAIARRMETANREIPHYHVMSTIDLGPAMAWLEGRNAEHPPGERILPAAMLLRATVMAAGKVPELNGWWRDGAFVPSPTVEVATAIALRGGGLVTPTISGADQMDLTATMRALRDLVRRARRQNLRRSDLAEASITVTNLGDQGAETVLGIINPPQVALVGFGRVLDTVLAQGGNVHVGPTVSATLSGDHRATDGHAGSRFLAAVQHALANPDQL